MIQRYLMVSCTAVMEESKRANKYIPKEGCRAGKAGQRMSIGGQAEIKIRTISDIALKVNECISFHKI